MKNSNDLSYKKKLRRENTTLRKKIARLNGEVGISEDVPEELENKFLQSVIEYEQQARKAKKIKIVDHIGRPLHFKPVNEINDNDIEAEWITLYDHLYNFGIDLQVCSPDVSAKELYRFATEELFKMRIKNISIPGMMTCFIYDEFYPDHKYENKQMAVDSCIMYFFSKKDFLHDFDFANAIRLNQYANLPPDALSEMLRIYRNSFEKTKDVRVNVKECFIENNYCKVTGCYKAIFIKSGKSNDREGDWTVHFSLDKKFKRWKICNVQIEGIEI